MAELTPTPTIADAGGGVRVFTVSGSACGADDVITLPLGETVPASVEILFYRVTVTGGGVTRVDPEWHSTPTGIGVGTREAAAGWGDLTPTTTFPGAGSKLDGLPVNTGGKIYLRPKPDGTGTAYSAKVIVKGHR